MSQTHSADTAPSIVIYGDFNCPFSAVADARSARLAADGLVIVDWRCVEHDPTIGPHDTPLTTDQQSSFDAELAQIGDLLDDGEPNHFRTPSRRLNTRDLNQLYASAAASVRPSLRSALFRAYWFDDLDLTDDAVVKAVTEAICNSAHADEARPNGRRLAATWQQEWNALPRAVVPTMVLPDGYVSRGLGALSRLSNGSISASSATGKAPVPPPPA
ncbi:MAG: DsbA family protein [Acidimicrobiia bacterium]